MSIAWVAGVFLGSMLSLPLSALIPLSAVMLVAALLCRRKAVLLWGGLCLVVLLGGLAWYGFAVSEPNLQGFCGQRVVIEGKVVRDTEYSEGGAWMGLSVERVWVERLRPGGVREGGGVHRPGAFVQPGRCLENHR